MITITISHTDAVLLGMLLWSLAMALAHSWDSRQ
jgi:hypothetical protein